VPGGGGRVVDNARNMLYWIEEFGARFSASGLDRLMVVVSRDNKRGSDNLEA
jgi:hypothetical protein